MAKKSLQAIEDYYVGQVLSATDAAHELPARPRIKFYKNAVDDILSGRKTLEPRPRSIPWIRRIEKAGLVDLTFGPRIGMPTVFAVARVLSVEIRDFSSSTREDVDRVGASWYGRPVKDFVARYEEWFAPQLAKGYPVAWIRFQVIQEGTDAPLRR